MSAKAPRRRSRLGPPGDPLIGCVRALRCDTVKTLLDNFHCFGDTVVYRVGPRYGPRWSRRDVIAVHHPSDIATVFADSDVYERESSSFVALRSLMPDGLLTVNGTRWLRQRRTMAPAFSVRGVKAYQETIAEIAERTVAEAVEAQPLELVRFSETYVLAVLSETLFGSGLEDTVRQHLQTLLPLLGTSLKSRSSPLHLPLSIPTPANRRFLNARSQMRQMVADLLQATPIGPFPAIESVIARVREATDPDTGAAMGPDELRDQILTFILAGFSTTATALAFCLYAIGRHKATQDALAAGDPAYTTAVVKESLRLYPPSFALSRRVADPVALGGVDLYRGDTVLVSPWVTHRHPGFWTAPDHFDPGRFTSRSATERYSYFPFGGGSRSCIGEHFAFLEIATVLKALMARVALDTSEADLRLVQYLSLKPATPLHAKVTVRSSRTKRALIE